MRQRVKVAHALVHNPSVVVLDEPLEGLDPRQRRTMIELFVMLGEQGRTVLVSSHVLDEVERFGSNVLVLAQGRLAAQGDFHAIRELMDERPHRIRVIAEDPRRLAAALMASGTVVGTHLESDQAMVVDTVSVADLRQTVARIAADEDIRLLEMRPLDDDLESVFRYLVGR
jgi:ABC-2 type transport system ATP-binding protein